MIGRRAMLTGAAAFAAASPSAGLGAGSRTGRKPPILNPGDTVAVISTASFADADGQLERADWWIKGMGLVPKFGTHVGDKFGYLAGTDANRAADFNAAFGDPAVKAVFAVRGGWGGARILPLIDWATVRANPKLLIGFSDLTALHLAFAARTDQATIHGGNASSSWPRPSWESLWQLAFAGATPVLGGSDIEAETGRPGRTINPGRARGRLLGGNLTVLSTLMGTPWLPDFSGAVLFLEDTDEAEYRIDRMFQQLRLAGILERVSGVVFGQCTRCTTTGAGYGGFTLDEVIDQYLRPLGVPAFSGGDIGHVFGQLCVPSGAEVELDAAARTLKLVEPIVG